MARALSYSLWEPSCFRDLHITPEDKCLAPGWPWPWDLMGRSFLPGPCGSSEHHPDL